MLFESSNRLKLFLLLITLMLASCNTALQPKKPNMDGHIRVDSRNTKQIPPLINNATALPLPKPENTQPVFSVVVQDVPIKPLLFSLVRDADLNLDISEDVSGTVTINAVDHTLSSILDRIARTANLYYEINDGVVYVRKDTPYLHNYRIDYLNLSRTSTGNVRVSTQISATGRGAGEEGGGDSNNNSDTSVSSSSENSFWLTLESNIAGIIGDGVASTVSKDQAHPDILINKEAGIIGVRATHKHHRQVAEFLSEVLQSSHRQVLIEATIAEVTLNKSHQTGVDWSLIDDGSGSGVYANQFFSDTSLISPPNLEISIINEGLGGGDVLLTTLRALEKFGDVSVMSSPKVMAMNNQTAMLKVVDNLVYFTVDVTVERGTDNSPPITTYITEINTVPVGFVMSVTPFVSEHDVVTLNVRPTISRVIDRVRDPNPDLAQFNVVNEIPVIQVREVESVLKVNSGDVAIIGGLMQDELIDRSNGIPILSSIPGIGKLFKYDEKNDTKTELVIFLKPRVIGNASLTQDLSDYQRFLPGNR